MNESNGGKNCNFAILIIFSCLGLTTILIAFGLRMKRRTAGNVRDGSTLTAVHVNPKVEVVQTPSSYDETMHSVVVGPAGSLQVATKVEE